MLSDIAHGHVDGADLCFLVALILFVVGGIYAFTTKAFVTVLVAFGLAFVALGWLIL